MCLLVSPLRESFAINYVAARLLYNNKLVDIAVVLVECRVISIAKFVYV